MSEAPKPKREKYTRNNELKAQGEQGSQTQQTENTEDTLNVEQEKQERRIEIAKYTVLKELFSILPGDPGYEYEVERRYRPKRLLSKEELKKISDRKTVINQAYISASDDAGNEKTVRLRRNFPEGKENSLQLEHKAKVKNPAARDEYRVELQKEDRVRTQEYEKLWQQYKWEMLVKTRYYIPHTIEVKNKKGEVKRTIQCEIHYDVHHGGRLDGFVRIEVEFKSDEDEAYVRQDKSLLPDWIGEDVTSDKRYGSKSLCKYGKPEEQSKSA